MTRVTEVAVLNSRSWVAARTAIEHEARSFHYPRLDSFGDVPGDDLDMA